MLYVASERHMREFPGSILPPWMPCDFEDANGQIIKHPNGGPPTIILVNTDTGKVIQYQATLNYKGEQIFAQQDLPEGLIGVLRIHMTYPAPLKCIPIAGKSIRTSPTTNFHVLPLEPIEVDTNGHSDVR